MTSASDLPPLLSSSLKSSQIACTPETRSVVIKITSFYENADKIRQAEQTIAGAMGGSVNVKVEVMQADAAAPRRATYRERVQEVVKDPLVKEAIDRFEARVVELDDNEK